MNKSGWTMKEEKEEQVKKLLDELGNRIVEPVRPGLAEDIKHQIPHRLAPHRAGMDTINIIIDLRINKLAAAGIIIITMILLANFFGSRDSSGYGIYQDSKMLVEYILRAPADRSTLSTVRARYEHLIQKGEQAVYYGDKADLQDTGAVLLQWRLPDGTYKVITADSEERTVSAEELIELLSRMLQKKK